MGDLRQWDDVPIDNRYTRDTVPKILSSVKIAVEIMDILYIPLYQSANHLLHIRPFGSILSLPLCLGTAIPHSY